MAESLSLEGYPLQRLGDESPWLCGVEFLILSKSSSADKFGENSEKTVP